MRFIGASLLGVLLLGISAGIPLAQSGGGEQPLLLAQDQSYCSRLGLLYCAPGPSGPGGCFGRGASCVSGLLCEEGLSQCSPGPSGPGGCYDRRDYNCFSGRICRAGTPGCP